MEANQNQNASQDWVALFGNAIDQWQAQFKQGAQAMGMSDTTLFDTAFRQFKTGQGMWLNVWNLFSETFKNVPTQAATPEAWQKSMTEYGEKVQAQFQTNFDQLNASFKDYNKLWDDYLGQFKGVSGTWTEWMGNAQDLFQVNEIPQSPQEWADLIPNWIQNIFKKSGGSLGEGPGLGIFRNYQDKFIEGFNTYQTARKAEAAYMNLAGKIWADVFVKMANVLKDRAQADKPITSIRELTRVWSGVADEVFIEAFKTQAYVEKQLAYLHATLAERKTRRELSEIVLTAQDLPTLSHIDDLIERVYLLRKDVRAIQKGQKSGGGQEVQALKAALQAQQEASAAQQKALAETQQLLSETRKALEGLQTQLASLQASQATSATPSQPVLFAEEAPVPKPAKRASRKKADAS